MRIVFIFICSLIVIACEKVITRPLPPHQPALVMHALLSPDREISLQLSQTASLENEIPDDLSVANGTVHLYEDDVMLAQLIHLGDGVYKASDPIFPEIGKSYRFSASAPDFATATSQAEVIPLTLEIQNPSFVDSSIANVNAGFSAGVFSATLSEDPATENFYGVDIEAFTAGGENLPTLKWAPDIDQEFGAICGLNSGAVDFSFTDDCLTIDPDQLATIRFAVQSAYQDINGTFPFDRIEVTLYHLSETYYQSLLNMVSLDGLELVFTYPPETFTNVNNGWGVVGSYTRTTYTFSL
ncbi:MAG: DUF4249 domain-containing protein [Bacteroidia bacterium]